MKRFHLDCVIDVSYRYVMMNRLSTSEAAKKLRIHRVNLQQAIRDGRIPAPKLTSIGGVKVRLWTKRDLLRAREALKKTGKGLKK